MLVKDFNVLSAMLSPYRSVLIFLKTVVGGRAGGGRNVRDY